MEPAIEQEQQDHEDGNAEGAIPRLLTELSSGDNESILSIVTTCPLSYHAGASDRSKVDNAYSIWAGTQGGMIHEWDLITLCKKGSLFGHTGAVLAMIVVERRSEVHTSLPERFCDASKLDVAETERRRQELDDNTNWLISSSGDGTIRVWNLFLSSALYLIHCPRDNMGDILSMTWIEAEVEQDMVGLESDDRLRNARGRGRLYAGCQDTSIMWIDLPPPAFYSFHSMPPSPLAPYSLLNPKPSSLTNSINSTPHLPSTISNLMRPTASRKSSLPIIHKPHNKFFDTLTPSERPRALTRPLSFTSTSPFSSYLLSRSAGGTSGELGLSTTSFKSLVQMSISPSTTPPVAAPVIRGFRDAMGVEIVESNTTKQYQLEEDRFVELQIRMEDVKRHAHHGYVYCLAQGKSNDRPVLISAGGDELIKLWTLSSPNTSSLSPVSSPSFLPPLSPTSQHPPSRSSKPLLSRLDVARGGKLTLIATLDGESDAVLALVVRDQGSTVVAGYQGGVIKIWDMDMLSCIKTLHHHSFDILTLTIINDDFYAGAADGSVQRFDKSFSCVGSWKAHQIVLATASTFSAPPALDGSFEGSRYCSQVGLSKGTDHLITGGSDAVLKIWDILKEETIAPSDFQQQGFQGLLFHTLAKLVSFKTIADDAHREECRQGALFLKSVFKQMGATTALLPGAPNRNPIVVATFLGNKLRSAGSGLPKKRKRVLCYGHYDVIPADDREKWSMDPFEMVGRNGWVLGRGVSDNKGPILAVAAAASELWMSGQLDVDLVMVIEGEEETGSAGFQEAIRSHASIIGDIDVILVSNSYWIGEDVPCLTFGLRGVIHATLKISSNQPDMHSGMQGGTVHEPLIDMVRLLSTLTDPDSKIVIPGFYDNVSQMSDNEKVLLDEVVLREGNAALGGKLSHLANPYQSLMSRWREPALSMHNISVVTGPASKTLISSSVSSTISVRIVPDQELPVIRDQIKAFLERQIDTFGTTNQLSVEIKHVADWWLGDLSSKYLKALAECIEQEWNIKPLYIREGGSIPSLPFLERQFNACAVHFPMGTSSDSAHLPDERIRVINLERGKNIVSKWLSAIAELA